MIDIKTQYAGLTLRNPLIVGSSGLTNNAERNKEFEKAGAGAIVLKSLFEEQIEMQSDILMQDSDYPEAADYIRGYVKANQIKDVSGKEKEPSCKEISNDIPWYSDFKSQVERIQKRENIDARGKMKELRNVLKQGQEATKAFIQFNKMEDVMLSGMQKNMTDHNKVGTGQAQKRELYPAMRNGLKDERTTVRSAIFDALEICDTYIGF